MYVGVEKEAPASGSDCLVHTAPFPQQKKPPPHFLLFFHLLRRLGKKGGGYPNMRTSFTQTAWRVVVGT